MICIYHSRDLDGFTSGAIVLRKYPDAKMIGFDYGQKLPMDRIPAGEPIIMIDVSLPMAEMEELAKHSGFQLTWIDHHASAIKDFKEYVGEGESFCTAVLHDGIAACEGGWRHLFPHEAMPEAIELLGAYDTWRNKDVERWEDKIMPFQYGMRLICNSPERFPTWLMFSLQNLDEIIKSGKDVLKYQEMIDEMACKNRAFEHTFEGYKAICLNGGPFNSNTFKSVYDPDKHDLMMPFAWDGKQWTVSLYTTKDIDCSALAKTRGGGGHKKASGFQTLDIKTVFNI